MARYIDAMLDSQATGEIKDKEKAKAFVKSWRPSDEATLKEFVMCPSASGHENDIAELFAKKANEIGLHTWVDGHGNAYASFGKPDTTKKTVLISGHGDEVGVAVAGFTDDGFVRIVDWANQLDPRILPGQEVLIKGKKDVPAIIGILPPHLQTAASANKVFEVKHLYADTGLSNEKIRELVSSRRSSLLQKKVCRAQKRQNRLQRRRRQDSTCHMLEVAKRLVKTQLNVNVVFASTSPGRGKPVRRTARLCSSQARHRHRNRCFAS